MKQRDYTSAKAKEALLKDKENYCGECCWFYGEMTDGEGFCAELKGAWTDMMRCNMSCCALREGKEGNYAFVSRQEMRHHMAVLLQDRRCMHDCNVMAIRKPVDSIERGKAIEFAYKYMKVFSKL